jgi:hypothetical protein
VARPGPPPAQDTGAPPQDSAPAAPAAVERVAGCSAATFAGRYLAASRPVILTDWLAGWPALAGWSLDALAARFGDAQVLVGRTHGDRLRVSPEAGVAQTELRFAEFLAGLREGRRDLYLISPVEERIPQLLDDIRPPEPWQRARFRSSRLWLGPAGVVTPLHHDLPENLYAQISGRKRVRLLARSERRNVYPYGRLSAAPNFSPVDAWQPDLARFPRFARVRPLDCVVGPGECLFIPRRWWHQVESLDPSASLNLWFANGATAVLAALSQRYARWRGLAYSGRLQS